MDTMRFHGPGMLGSIASHESVPTEKAAHMVLFGSPSHYVTLRSTRARFASSAMDIASTLM
jgi:hypothetical protein